MINNMYGSIHTHFEDSYDAVNDMKESVFQFILQGAVKVAATGHGVFTEFEDIQDTIAEARSKASEVERVLKDEGYDFSLTREKDGHITPYLKDYDIGHLVKNKDLKDFVSKIGIFNHLSDTDVSLIKENPALAVCYMALVNQFEVVPGIEAYFEDDKSHMILIAKDYEGYCSLSKIISQAAEDYKEVPIVTLQNLKDNVLKDHIFCTSACIGGIFGKPLVLKEFNLKQKIDKLESQLDEVKFGESERLINERAAYKKVKKATKAETTKAEKLVAKENDYSLKEEVDRKNEAYAHAQDELLANEEIYDIAERIVKANNRRYAQLVSYQTELADMDANAEVSEANVVSLYNELEDVFGKDNFYFEIQNHGLEAEREVYNKVIEFAYNVGNPKFIASNDIHVCVAKGDTKEENAVLEDALIRRNVAKFSRFNKYQAPSEDDKEYYIKTDGELKAVLNEMVDESIIPDRSKGELIDGAISNIKELLSSCEVEFPKNQEHYPKFCDDENQMFDDLVEQGVHERFPNGLPEGYRERIDYEKGVIKTMGYSGYHLIVQDYLNYGKLLGYLTEAEVKDAPLTIEELKGYVKEKHPEGNLGLGIGPGRGSAGGSLCCYLLGITEVDPIRYGLLFERFLNVERVSMPDIDSDFRSDVREKTYEYCKQKYGQDRVCKVLTKTYLAEKGAIKMVARYLAGRDASAITDSFDEHIEAAKLSAADIKEKKAAIKAEAEQISKEYLTLSNQLCKKYDELTKKQELSAEDIDKILRKEFASDNKCEEILDLSKKIENMFTVYGKHAAGVIISKDPISSVIPLMYDEKDAVFKTQCVPAQAEAKGLLKMDFLGLTNLSIITNILRTEGKEDYSLQSPETINKILENKDIYQKIFSTGLTHGVFQFESPGMKRMLMEFKPESFDDIVLLVAAYRPGPIDYIPEIIKQKWHEKDPKQYPEPKRSISLKNEALSKILEPTYGCPIYQEQIMQIFQDMAGYSLGGADVVRRYMSKKKVDKLAHEKHTFIYGDPDRNIPGCMEKQGITEEEAADLFEQMMPFAKYGFNKSHAVEYAFVSMYTAYLKYEHTADFYRCSMEAMDNVEKLVPYIEEAKSFGIEVLPPDIMRSDNQFKVDPDNEKAIIFGFSSIKGIGSLAMEHRTKNAYEFIKENSQIPVKDVQKLAELGLFSKFYPDNKISFADERKFVNKTDIAGLVEKYGASLRNYFKMNEDASLLKEDIISIPEGTEERVVAEDSLESLKAKIEVFKNDFDTAILECKSQALSLQGQVDKAENDDAILNKEKEYLGYEFSKQGLLLLFNNLDSKELSYGGTFKDLPQKGDYSDEDKVHKVKDNGTVLPVVVIDGGENKIEKNKKGIPYHKVKLMDKSGEVIERRYKNAISEKVGWLNVYGEDSKYFTNSKTIEPVPYFIKNKIKAESSKVSLSPVSPATQNLQDYVITTYKDANEKSIDDYEYNSDDYMEQEEERD